MITLKFLLSCIVLPFLQLALADRILVQVMPGAVSHLLGALAITEELQGRGHEVAVAIDDWDLAGLRSKRPSPGVRFLVNPAHGSVAAGRADWEHHIREMHVMDPLTAARVYTLRQADCCRRFANAATMAKVRAFAPDLVLADVSYVCGNILAEVLDVPLVSFSPVATLEPVHASLFSYPAPPASVPAVGSGFTPLMSFKQRVANLLLHKAVSFLTMRMATSEGNRLRQELGLPPLSLQAAFARARLLLVGSAPAFEFPRPLPPFVKMVGSLMAAPAKALPPDLEAVLRRAGPRGAAFVSFGSVFVLTEDAEVRALAAALGALNRTVLWRISPEQLPPGVALQDLCLPERVHTVGWAPQNDVLGSPHVGVFVTHAGLNSVQEAAYHGVPIVCVPFVGEQLDNAAKAEYHGFGVTVSRASLTAAEASTPSQLVGAVEKVTLDPGYRQRAGEMQRLMRVHPRAAAAVAVDWVEYALAMPAGGGMGLRDPAAELPWPVAASLDVYAALAGAAAAAAWALWRAVKACAPRRRRAAQTEKKVA